MLPIEEARRLHEAAAWPNARMRSSYDCKPVVTGGALWNAATKHTVYEQPFDPNNCAPWVMVSDNEYFRNYELTLPDGNIIRKTENKNVEQMLEDNQRELNDNAGRKWGDGKSFLRCPMTTVFQLGHWAKPTSRAIGNISARSGTTPTTENSGYSLEGCKCP